MTWNKNIGLDYFNPSKPVKMMLKGVGNLGERVRDVCYKNLILNTSANLGIHKFLID